MAKDKPRLSEAPAGLFPEADGKASAKKAAPEKKPHYAGHRERLRDRFLRAGPEALQDYELLELILFRAIPRRDVKPLAKDLIDRFGGFAGVLGAGPERLAEVPGLGQAAITELSIIQAAAVRLTHDRMLELPVISSWSALQDYVRMRLRTEKVEQFRILFLDNKNRLIADEQQQRGTVNHTPVYPREVIKRALELHASAIILVHNHPSGDPTPSRDDIAMTARIISAAQGVNIAVHDHLIVGRERVHSFKAEGLI